MYLFEYWTVLATIELYWLYKSAQQWNYFQLILILATGKRGNQYGTDHLGKVTNITALTYAKSIKAQIYIHKADKGCIKYYIALRSKLRKHSQVSVYLSFKYTWNLQ